ncbi:DUF3017 domain-containing protein [Actinobacteria bacterium YIM 96077]|uniref:DUF3017 domain-containing protein n=1 Tax=Phytoactinopolyspora halophila TaxID=1981511 RepID=A0A329QJB9_9ACTN|nr:DUF3017 domain-containing protein [Phytoactinopolyspora halophila]AYY14469.1 DUF3017 domain-containing protein [Actinobacteria bacterium YIM 96077]RAW11462.1 DUF3017 domain-containing protein [Phytoactinopolyspora halophila]
MTVSNVSAPKRSRWAAAAERRLTPASWLRAVVRQWPFLIGLGIVVGGIVVVADDHFKRGTVIIAGGICVAAFFRAVLPNRWVGLLQVRSRLLDVLTLALLGGGTLIAALIVPPPS